jgi:CRISPR/Cas system-associated exonuclease Cas4 (RecB family)
MSKYEGVAEAIDYLLDKGECKSWPRPYLGMSQLGEECPRSLWYYFHWADTVKHKWKSKRIFSMGDAVEEIIVKELERIGLKVTETQTSLAYADGFMRGHIDGIVSNLPDFEDQKFLLEVKSMKNSKWKSFVKNGFSATYPQYWTQLQVYMYLMGVTAGLFIVMNKDTSEVTNKIVELDKEHAEDKLKLGEDIIRANVPPLKISDDPSYYICRWCDFYDVCWLEKPFLKNCRTCKHVEKKAGTWRCTEGDEIELRFEEDQKCPCSNYDMIEV